MLTSPDSSIPLPLLITGITGVAGLDALAYFQRRYPGQVIGIRPTLTRRLVGPGIVPLDAEDRHALRDLFLHWRFRAVLHAAGNCALKACELNPAMARQINVASADTISEQVHQWGSRLVHLSSDLVFSGSGAGNYVETDVPDPVTIYGKTMVEAEALMQQRIPASAILRISLPMGPSFNRHAGAIDWIDSRFRAGRPATLYFDEVRSSTYVEDLSRTFERFLAGSEAGIYHLGGPRPLSLYQIGQVINRIGGYDPRLLKGCPRQLAGPIPPRAGNVTLDSSKLCQLLGSNPLSPWPLAREMVPTDPAWHSCRDRSTSASFRMIERYLYRKQSIISQPGGESASIWPGAGRYNSQ